MRLAWAFSLLLLALLPTAQCGLNDNLIGYWTLEEGQGNVVYDHSGGNLDASLHGSRWVHRGNFNSLYFDTTTYVDMGSRPQYALPNGTLSLWILCNNSSGGLIAMLEDEQMSLRLERDEASGKLLFRIITPQGEQKAFSKRSLTLDQWIHVALAFSPEEATMYVSAVQQGDTLSPGCALAGKPHLFVGGAVAEKGFWGEVADIRLYDAEKIPGEMWLLARSVEPLPAPAMRNITESPPALPTPEQSPTPTPTPTIKEEPAPTPSEPSLLPRPLNTVAEMVETPITPASGAVFAALAVLVCALGLRRRG